MKLVINHTKKESFLYDDNKIAGLNTAYSLVNSYEKTWDFTDDKIIMREYTRIDYFFDRLTKKKHLSL